MISAATFNDVLIAMFVFGGALIGGIAKIVHSLAKTRSENRSQHGSVGEALTRLTSTTEMVHDELRLTRSEMRDDIKAVHARINDHIVDHDSQMAQVIAHPKHNTGGNSAA